MTIESPNIAYIPSRMRVQQQFSHITISLYRRTHRLQGSSHRLVGERNLRYYPCSLALAGANGSKSNNLVSGIACAVLCLVVQLGLLDVRGCRMWCSVELNLVE
jgi:hypothetical protein